MAHGGWRLRLWQLGEANQATFMLREWEYGCDIGPPVSHVSAYVVSETNGVQKCGCRNTHTRVITTTEWTILEPA
jgi:hypothetical protein